MAGEVVLSCALRTENTGLICCLVSVCSANDVHEAEGKRQPCWGSFSFDSFLSLSGDIV